ncbi:MAG: hypothetical protein IJ334_17175, partial [Clostridia bacterium]|nr:hypothetical protein [Clostridia bacterium]
IKSKSFKRFGGIYKRNGENRKVIIIRVYLKSPRLLRRRKCAINEGKAEGAGNGTETIRNE